MHGRALLVCLVLLGLGAAEAGAHGTTLSPASRNYICRYLDRDSKPCANAWAANPQALYDWMGILISDANGRHRKLIDDGELCSASDPKFGMFDETGAWPATGIAPGRQTFKWVLNAPHATKYYRFYITEEGYDPAQPVRWDDLQLIHDSGRRGLSKVERFAVDVPARTGRHVVYSIWQRSDSPEAFYACSDVVFGAPGTVPVDPPLPDESLNQPGGGHGGGGHGGKPSGKGIRLRRALDEDWGAGYCATVTVVNRSRKRRTWRGSMRLEGTITGLWNAVHKIRNGRLRVRGEAYNAVLAPGARTTFGYCANR